LKYNFVTRSGDTMCVVSALLLFLPPISGGEGRKQFHSAAAPLSGFAATDYQVIHFSHAQDNLPLYPRQNPGVWGGDFVADQGEEDGFYVGLLREQFIDRCIC
jgi:hypothetical protein